MLTEVGEVEIAVPRDRDASFEPRIVKKRQRRLSGVDELVISLAAKGLTTGEIAAHFADVYGAEVSRDTISRITDRVLEEMAAWQSRPLDQLYPVIFIDAIQVKIRDGQVANRPVYASRAQHLPLCEQAVLVRARPRPPYRLHRIDRASSTGALRRVRRQVGRALPRDHPPLGNAWAEFVPFLAYNPEIRKVLYSTDERVKRSRTASVVESGWVRVTPDRRAGRGDGSPAAQDCRLTASEPLPGGGARARSLRGRFRSPIGDELSVGDLALLAESSFTSPHLFEVVGVGGAALAAARGLAGAELDRTQLLRQE